MRDILNLLDSILIESEGLTNRKPGTLFTNPEGKTASFKHLAFFPAEGGAYTPEELAQAVQDIQQQIGQEIQFTNLMKKGGFGVAEFELDNGQPMFAGRYFQQIQVPYNNNNWKNNDIPGGYALQSKSTKKESAGYGPSDVLTILDNLNSAKIIEQIQAKFGPDSPLLQAANLVAAGNKKFTISGEGIQFEAFRDYFCEILHPIAMASGAFDGNAREAEAIFFKGSSFADATISFGASKTNGLYDSLMENAGRKIKLSSKGDGGAAASVSNLSEAVDILAKAGQSKQILDQYKSTIDIIQTIKKASAESGPLELGIELGIISQREAQTIVKLKDSAVPYRSMEAQIQKGNNPDWMTKNLLKIWNSVGCKVPDKATPYFKMLAGLAKQVGAHINTKTNFGDAATAILNHSALIQVDTKATQLANGDIQVIHFQTTYPSTVVSAVEVLSGDTYMSHKVHGRFSFKIYKGNSKPTQAELEGNVEPEGAEVAPADPTQMSTQDLDNISQQRSNVKASAGGPEKLGSEKALGRKRQR